MVGAQLLGEFAWSIENLLNRVINQTLEITPSMVAFVMEASAALPQLLEQLEIGLAPKVDVQLLMKQAEAFAEGDPDAASITGESLRIQVPQAAQPPPEPGMDPVLADIFVKEMRGHLGVIRRFLGEARPGAAPHSVDEPLYRACHTLLGSARMAGFEPAMQLAAPLAEHLRRYFDSGIGITDAAVAALRSAADQIEAMAEAIAAGRNVELDPSLLQSLEPLTFREPAPEVVADAPAGPEGVPPPVAQPELPAAAVVAGGFDPEIAAIFAEEAAEILDSSEAALQEVRQRQDQPAVAMLQRFLHTLKGGARMAGVLPMGDLSHALETLLARIAEGRSRATPAAVELVQRGLDELQQMRDAIDSGRAIASVSGLVAELEGFEATVVVESAIEPPPAQVVAVPAPPLEAVFAEPPVGSTPPSAEAEHIRTADLTDADLQQLESIVPGAPPRELLPDPRVAAAVLEEPTVEEPISVDEALLTGEATIVEQQPDVVVAPPEASP
jgi:chemosensory pili system protein ChpA (sensor histidine kinase/response regulator)